MRKFHQTCGVHGSHEPVIRVDSSPRRNGLLPLLAPNLYPMTFRHKDLSRPFTSLHHSIHLSRRSNRYPVSFVVPGDLRLGSFASFGMAACSSPSDQSFLRSLLGCISSSITIDILLSHPCIGHFVGCRPIGRAT